MQPERKIIHAVTVDPVTGAVSVRIYHSSVFVQQTPVQTWVSATLASESRLFLN